MNHNSNKLKRAFRFAVFHGSLQGVTTAAMGAIAGAAYILGRRALMDLPTIIIGVTTFFLLRKEKRIPEPLLILAAGIAGLLLFKGQ